MTKEGQGPPPADDADDTRRDPHDPRQTDDSDRPAHPERQSKPDGDRALRAFLQRVWRDDITPLLSGPRAEQRRNSARWGGKVAAAGGLAVDSLFRLRGRPFTRAMTVLGSTFGAILPDAWDWRWLRQATEKQREVVRDRVRQRAEQMSDREALDIFGLSESATHEQLRHAWRLVSQRWHPDKAPDDEARSEYHVRFIACRSAYDRLEAAYAAGRLPRKSTQSK